MDNIDEKTWELINQYAVPAVTALIIIFVAFLVAAWVSRIVVASCNRAKIDTTLGKFFGRAVRWIVLLIAGLFVLSEFGIETASFAVILGAAGLAIGLAFQGTLSNFAAGIMLLIFRPFKVGDVVNVAGQLGKVDEIQLFTTTLDTFDNRRIILPNSAVFGATIENITYHPYRRIDVAVGTEYSADIDKTREVLEKAAADVPGRRDDPAPAVFLMGLGASSIDWHVRVWADGDVFGDVKQAATRQVKVALDEAGIGIPFPQMDVHMDKPEAGDK
ncbi:mechanosensitive ion channel family protein [Planctomycetales bacterium ZRK34]|nr:mechanosensitive ion channel family protein [Planctomycetales bacterium ZRK34]